MTDAYRVPWYHRKAEGGVCWECEPLLDRLIRGQLGDRYFKEMA